MPIRAVNPPTPTPTLAQQKADFTAEGAPPPGKVSTEAPVTADPAEHPVKRVYGTIKLKHPRTPRHH